MSNSISFTCDCCGREVGGCNIVNGMKFCAKCYQETFGFEPKYVDMLNKESSDLLVCLLAEKDKQIAELQKQLKSQPAEIMEKIKEFVDGNAYYYEEEQYAKHIIKYLDDILKEYQK